MARGCDVCGLLRHVKIIPDWIARAFPEFVPSTRACSECTKRLDRDARAA